MPEPESRPYFPDWLRQGLIENSFPWERSYEHQLSTFLEKYTLHDSLWIGVWVRPDFGAVAAIRWEVAWNEGIEYEGDENPSPADYPILLVWFHASWAQQPPAGWRGQVDFFGPMGVVAASTRPIDQPGWGLSVTLGAMRGPTSGIAVETTVENRAGVSVTIEHNTRVSILCMSRNGNVISIPGLSSD